MKGGQSRQSLVFLGTPQFAVPTLERIVEAGHEVVAVFTQPDRPKGRGQKDAMPPVKEAALRLGLAVHQPERVRRPEVVEQLRALGPAVMVVVGYGQIIPQAILDIPPKGIINVHASLLPKYRGAAPIQWAIARGETRTGVTTMKIDAGLDTGDMLLKWGTEIGPEETGVELGERLAGAGADLLVKTLTELPTIVPEKQDEAQATYAPILKKEDGRIDFSMAADEIVNRVRGLVPWPGCYGSLRGQRFHIWKARQAEGSFQAGELRAIGKSLYAGCKGGAIELLEVQLEGKKRMAASGFSERIHVERRRDIGMSLGIAYPGGFRYAATYAGIRKVAKDDLALIVSDTPASAAAVFTKNLVVAAPVDVARRNLRESHGKMRAWLINAGNANCATRTGERVALECVRSVAKTLGVQEQEVLPASTGVIGVEMNARLIVDTIPELAAALRPDSFDAVAAAIMTTDTRAKTAFAKMKRATMAGMAKGSGMIHPRMATTLGFVMTDAVASPAELRAALKKAIGVSFNRISVDGDTSTNDVVSVMANGASGFKPGARALEAALTEVLSSLAKQIARDGEGARKLVTIDVEGTATDREAETIARTIANSPLVKTAIAGSDPNWGRVLAAAGYSGVKFDPRKTDIFMQGLAVCRSGLAAAFSEAELTRKLDESECLIRFVIRGGGKGRARFWTCDLTEEYIRINASYRT